jgi:glutaredoxin
MGPNGTFPAAPATGTMRPMTVASIARRVLLALTGSLLVLLVSPLAAPGVRAQDEAETPVAVILFWGDGCPHCAAEKAFLDELVARHPEVVVTDYEVWYDADNRALLARTAAERGIEVDAVPVTFVGDRHWIGYSEATGTEIEAAVVEALAARTTPSPGAASPSPTPAPSGTVAVGPFEIDATAGSLVATTSLIALVDGFNPCSLWVLSILLAMMLHSGSRRRLLAVGVTFLAVAGVAYALFMLGLFVVLDWIGYETWVRVAVAAVVGLFGIVAVKDYVWFGRGFSFSIPEDRKPGITRRSRELALSQRSLFVIVPMTALLAAGVAFLELPCTAGFPVMWNGILTTRGVAGMEYAGLLALYIAIYLLDEAVLFTIAFVTMRATRMQERHGRVLKLVAGSVMLTLAVVMLVAPNVLDSTLGAIAVFAGALGAAGLAMIALPRLGLVRPESAPERASAHASRSRQQRVKRAVH